MQLDTKIPAQQTLREHIFPLTFYRIMRAFNNPKGKMPFENSVESGENADEKHFILFPRKFSTERNFSFLNHTGSAVCKMVSIWTNKRLLTQARSENIVRKGEIACYKQFLLFSQCFLPYMALIFHFKCTLNGLQFV